MGGIYSTPASAAAFAATGMISLAPNVILLLMPNYAAGGGETPTWLALGLAMGAGALLADVFLHTLAESTDKQTGMYVMTGFTIFFAVDLFVRFVNDDSLQSHSYQTRRSTITGENGGHTKEQSSAHSKNRSIVLLNLAADALHNFTDGLAIGASYSIMDTSATSSATSSATAWSMLRSHTRGGFATLSIFFHEVPHELSDFCTLVRGGYSARQAIMAQGFTAIAAFAGTATAICVSEEAWAEERLLWITAGGFLYLAGTTILPEVLVEEGRGERSSTKTSRGLFRLAQLAAFCTGILFLSMVDSLSGDDHHHNHQSPHDHHGHNHWHHDHSIDKHRQHAEL